MHTKKHSTQQNHTAAAHKQLFKPKQWQRKKKNKIASIQPQKPQLYSQAYIQAAATTSQPASNQIDSTV